MRLKDRVSKLTRSHIVFPDLLYGLSSTNNEPLYDVIEYLINTGFDTLNVFSLGSRCEMSPNEDPRKTIYFFLESIRAAIPQDNLDWVITDSDSFDALTTEAEQNLMNLFSTGSLMYFKVSELLSFAPLDGFLEFLEPDTVSEEVENTISQGNNSLASYVAEYTLPQVVALILHIDLADITTTANNSYIHNQNDYDESFYHKFANLLQAYSVAALNNKIDGVDLHTRSVTPYKGDTETHVDLEKTSISRGDLDTYLASTGHELDDLIAEQVSIHPQRPPYDSLPHSFERQDSELVSNLQQQVAELQARLDEKDKAFKAQSEKLNAALEKAKQAGKSTSQLSEHEEMSYQLITSVLIQMMTNERGIHNKKPFPSEAEIIREIEAIDLYGYKKGTLAKRFQGAREKLENELRKKTPPRTLDIFQQESTLKKLG